MKLKQLIADDDAVSPVIGVVLMVAVTVMLAAVIGTVVMDLGSDVQQNAQASVTFEETGDNEVIIQITSVQNADELSVDSDVGNVSDGDFSDPSAGTTATVDSLTDDANITVTATYQGSTNVIATYDYDNS